MTTHTKDTVATLSTLCTQRITALQALPTTTQITVNGLHYTPAQAIAIYQAVIAFFGALATKRNEEEVALEQSRTANTAARTFDKGLVAWATTSFPVGDPTRKSFGADPKPRTPLTAQALVDAQQKGEATRKARGTKGPKEKLKIKGTIVAPTAQAAPAPNPTVTTVTVMAPGGSPQVTSPAVSSQTNGVITHS